MAQNTSTGINLDLRVHATGGKEATVNAIGDVVLLDLYVRVWGQDANPTNDGLQHVSGGITSSTGGLLGDILGLNPVSPFDQTSRNGLQSDPDGDGDLDVVGNTSDVSGWYFARSSSPTFGQPVGGFYVGRMQFTATSLTGGSAQINWLPRLDGGSGTGYYDSGTIIDGVYTGIPGYDPRYSLGAPVVIRADVPPDERPTQYLAGDINEHLTVSGKVRPQPGSTFTIKQGLDVTATGDIDTENGPHVSVRDAISGNAGGTLRSAGGMTIGSASGAVFEQGGGFTQIGSTLVVGDADGSGRLNVTGGTLLAAAAHVGGNGGGNGLARQTGGVANLTNLVLGNGSGHGTYELLDGELSVSGDAFIAEGGGGALHQSGGTSHFGASLYVGGDNHATAGTLRMSGGQLNSADLLRVGTLGAGVVEHTGGEIRGIHVIVGDHAYSDVIGPAGRYTISGASRLLTTNLNIGRGGNGVFIQNGGEVVSTSNLFVSTDAGGTARFELHDGSLRSHIVHVGWSSAPLDHPGKEGLFVQDGGSHVADQILIRHGGEYRHTGGVLIVKDQLTNRGTLDFGNTSVTLNADRDAFIDLSRGTLAGHDNVNFVGAAGTLFSFPSGFDPFTRLGSFTTDGLVHVAGQPLAIPEGHSVSGSGTIAGSVTNAGAVNPGHSPGVLGVEGSYTQTNTGALRVELAGTDAALFDALSVVGAASVAGTLDVALLDDFVPSASDTFTILTASSLSGTFTNAPAEIAFAGGVFDVLYGPTSVTLANFQSIPEPASLAILALAPMLLTRRRR